VELGLLEGFQAMADLGFLISEIKKIPLFFTKYRNLHFRNPTSEIPIYGFITPPSKFKPQHSLRL
jgi:hypothetical protein